MRDEINYWDRLYVLVVPWNYFNTFLSFWIFLSNFGITFNDSRLPLPICCVPMNYERSENILMLTGNVLNVEKYPTLKPV